jgi:NAD(P)-dependent dehydrogenase (short-subunit alcohol dehydrogenase family)
MGLLAGKTTLITGALGTIGKALAMRHRQEGAKVTASDRSDMQNVDDVVRPLGAGIRYFGADLNDLPGTERAVGEPAAELGGIDILINNAAFVVNKPHEEFSIQEYEDEVRINSSAALVLSRACSKHMKQKKSGRIVNLTSLTLTGHWEGFVPYVASKGAMYGPIKAVLVA